MKTPGKVSCIGFSPDGASFATGYGDGTARIWQSANALPASGNLPHGASPSLCLFSSDSRWLVTASDGQTTDEQSATLVRGWDARTGELVFVGALDRLGGQFPKAHSSRSKMIGRVATVFFGPDNRQLYVLTVSGLLTTFDLNPDLRPLKDVSREVGVRSGAQFDRRGGLSFDGVSLLSATPNISDERKQ